MPLFHCNFSPQTLGRPTNVSVFLPSVPAAPEAGYRERYPQDVRFRTLYLLHGMNGDETSWLRKTNVERYAQHHQIALVMPSVQNSFYTDTKVGLAFFTYLTEELPAMLRATFPLNTARESSFIAGLSMGGYGALKAAFTRPDLYCAVGSFSGATDVNAVAQKAENEGGMPLFRSVFGDPEQLTGSSADLFSVSADLKKSAVCMPRTYIACGTDDALCYEMNLRFHQHLDELAFPHNYFEGPGAHEWDFWEQHIRIFLDWLEQSPAQ